PIDAQSRQQQGEGVGEVMSRVGQQRQAARAKPREGLEHHKPRGQDQRDEQDSLHPPVIARRRVRMRMLRDAFHHFYPTTTTAGPEKEGQSRYGVARTAGVTDSLRKPAVRSPRPRLCWASRDIWS